MFSNTLLQQLNAKLDEVLGNLSLLSPELVLAGGILLIILLDLIVKKKGQFVLRIAALGILLISGLLVEGQYQVAFDYRGLRTGMLWVNPISVFFKFIFLLAGILTILLSTKQAGFISDRLKWGEYFALLLTLILGLNLLAVSVNLLMIYLSLELVSICSYMLAIFQFNKKSTEGAIKYLLFGAMSSGFMLYGMSLLYGFTGSLEIYDQAFIDNLLKADPLLLLIVFTLTVTGLFFKIAILPFHIWVPDVYEAAPTPIVAFFSVAPKAAGLLVLSTLSGVFMLPTMSKSSYSFHWIDLLAILAISTILVGNLAALWQNNAKRLLAYSSIAHAGFLLIGLVAHNPLGLQSLIFYLGIYLFMNFGAFLFIEFFATYYVGSNKYDIREYQGLGIKYPFMGICITLIMIALTGLPPTAGFTAKLLIFSALWESYQTQGWDLLLTLFIIGLLNTAISLFYYLKIPFYLFLRKPILESPQPNLPKPSMYGQILLVVLVLMILVLFFKADWLLQLSDKVLKEHIQLML